MKGYLSKELQKYYTRVGNRVVFSNGMTLNQLALEMWENLKCHGIDASVLSRVINGERVFTTNELSNFTLVLHLSKNKADRLKMALSCDLNDRFGLEIDSMQKNSDSLLVLSNEILKKIRELKTKDYIMDTGGFLDQVLCQLKAGISKSFNDQTSILLQRVYAELLIEKIYSLQVTKSKEDSFRPIICLSNKVARIGMNLKDNVYIYIAKAHIGDIFYINHNYEDSIKNLEEAIKYFDKRATKLYPWTPLRPLALSYAHLGKETEFDKVKGEIVKTLPSFGIDAQCLAIEGIAKGEAILGNGTQSDKYFDKEYAFYSKLRSVGGNFEHLMRLLIVTGELESAKYLLSSRRQSNYIENIGKEGIEIAKQYCYKRHEDKIRCLLSDLLN